MLNHCTPQIEMNSIMPEPNKALAHRFHLEMLQEGKFDLKITGLDLFRIAGGKIVEMWQEADYLGMMQQMGAIPSR
jgi:predicted SnoaL-like aldol condensation-catalyzing enzyme